MLRAFLRVVSQKRVYDFSTRPCAYRVRALGGSHQGTMFEAVLRPEFVPRQKLVQQHSGDWTMAGKVPVARVVEAKAPLPRSRSQG